MEKITTEGEEFGDGENLTFTQSWNNHRVEIRGILRKRGDKWVIEYMDGFTPKIEQLENGLRYVKLKKIPTYVRPEPPPQPPPRVLTEEERLAQEATAMKQQEIARQAEITKKETEAEEDRVAETVYERIPCSSQRVNISDSVLYNDKPATVTDVLYEITYEDESKEVVKCDDALINVSYAIKQNKDILYRKRHPIGYGVNERGGKRTKRKNKKNRKTRYGMETRS